MRVGCISSVVTRDCGTRKKRASQGRRVADRMAEKRTHRAIAEGLPAGRRVTTVTKKVEVGENYLCVARQPPGERARQRQKPFSVG